MNRNELLVGFLLTLCLTPFMGALGLVALVACPFFYAYSGMNGHDKIWRRLGVPIIWASAIYSHSHHWTIFLAVPMSYASLTLGYGIVDSSDKGSVLGNFFLKLCGGDYWWANFCTRLTIYGLALCPMLLLK